MDGASLQAEQRRRARRLGLALWLVVASIVFYVFGYKLGWFPGLYPA